MNQELDATVAGPDLRLEGIHQVDIQPGGFWSRFGAAFVDGIIASVLSWIVTIPVALIIGVMIGMSGDGDVDETTEAVLALLNFASSIFGLAVGIVYYGYFYSQKGATPGKMMFKLRVIHTATGSNVTFLRGALRDSFGKFLSAILLMIGYLMAAFRKDKKALHDLMFDTQVIKTN